MSYEPKEWVCGDTITADDLNHIENGVESANKVEFFIVHFTDGDNNTKVSDKTAEEIGEAIDNGKVPFGIFSFFLGDMRVGDGFCFIERFTGRCHAEFNGINYGTGTGNVWETY